MGMMRPAGERACELQQRAEGLHEAPVAVQEDAAPLEGLSRAARCRP